MFHLKTKVKSFLTRTRSCSGRSNYPRCKAATARWGERWRGSVDEERGAAARQCAGVGSPGHSAGTGAVRGERAWWCGWGMEHNSAAVHGEAIIVYLGTPRFTISLLKVWNYNKKITIIFLIKPLLTLVIVNFLRIFKHEYWWIMII